jgi:hypothetical protein
MEDTRPEIRSEETRPMDVPTRLMPSLADGAADSRLRVVLVRGHESVEALLDWLERSGRANPDVLVLVDEFVVRWRE